ncbi:MAG: hypothetical protein Kow0099_39490 [Candidatus Abyssubacteria bacterium]
MAFVAFCLTLAVCAFACRIVRRGPPNVVLISIDTLRADHFTREYMPKTYAWAKKHGIIYTNAQSPDTWTKPSHVSMFTGLRPSEHRAEGMSSYMPADVPVIAEDMKKQGYHTVAFVGGAQISREWKMDRGFDEWQEDVFIYYTDYSATPFQKLRERYWEPLEQASDWVRGTHGEPYFLFIHTYGVHEFFLWGFDPDDMLADSEGTNEQIRAHRQKQLAEKGPEAELAAYRAAIRECDDKLSPLLKSLKNAVVILTADHGEGFAYFGDEPGHTHAPTADQTHVPLVLTGFGRGLHKGVVTTLDIRYVLTQSEPFPQRSYVIAEDIYWGKETQHRDVAYISDSDRKMVRLPLDSMPTSSQLSEHAKAALTSLGYME